MGFLSHYYHNTSSIINYNYSYYYSTTHKTKLEKLTFIDLYFTNFVEFILSPGTIFDVVTPTYDHRPSFLLHLLLLPPLTLAAAVVDRERVGRLPPVEEGEKLLLLSRPRSAG